MRITIIGLCAIIITITAQNLYLKECLDQALIGQNYDYKIMRRYSEIVNRYAEEIHSLKNQASN